jgi:predicted protein tyrosine phosphatase
MNIIFLFCQLEVLRVLLLPESTNLRFAKAMTTNQADLLCEFVKKIPKDATINVHCVYGESRSMGVALAIENKDIEILGNRYVHKLVRERLHK